MLNRAEHGTVARWEVGCQCAACWGSVQGDSQQSLAQWIEQRFAQHPELPVEIIDDEGRCCVLTQEKWAHICRVEAVAKGDGSPVAMTHADDCPERKEGSKLMRHPDDMTETERQYWEYEEGYRSKMRAIVHDPGSTELDRQLARDHLARGLEA